MIQQLGFWTQKIQANVKCCYVRRRAECPSLGPGLKHPSLSSLTLVWPRRDVPRRYKRWIRGLGGEKLPTASYTLLPNLKKGIFLAIGEGSIILVACFLHRRAQTCLYQTPGRRPLRIIRDYARQHGLGCLVEKNTTLSASAGLFAARLESVSAGSDA